LSLFAHAKRSEEKLVLIKKATLEEKTEKYVNPQLFNKAETMNFKGRR